MKMIRKIYSITVPGNVSHARKHTVQKVREITISRVLNTRVEMFTNKKLHVPQKKIG